MMRSGAESKNPMCVTFCVISAESAESGAVGAVCGLSASGEALLLSLFIQRKPWRNQTAAQYLLCASDRLQGIEGGFYKPVAEIPTAKPNATERKLDGMGNVKLHRMTTAKPQRRNLRKSGYRWNPNPLPMFPHIFPNLSPLTFLWSQRSGEFGMRKNQVDHGLKNSSWPPLKNFSKIFKNSSWPGL